MSAVQSLSDAGAGKSRFAGACVARRTREGKPKRESIRCLKRYIAREIRDPGLFREVLAFSFEPFTCIGASVESAEGDSARPAGTRRLIELNVTIPATLSG